MRLDGPKLKVQGKRMGHKLQALSEKAQTHPDRKTRELFRQVIEQIHNRHVQR